MQPLYKSCYPLDHRCYDEYNLTEDILMEHASQGMVDYIKAHFLPQSSVLIVAGVGNNGADGIVLARLLQSYYQVKLYLPFGIKSVMARIQIERGQPLDIEIVDEVEEADIIVDAIFGAGLSRELNEPTRKLITKLQSLKGFKIACDVPTGIDINGNPLPMALFVDVSITMGALKECLYSDMAKDFVGEIICVDLGISHAKYTEGFKTDIYLLEESDMKLPTRVKKTSFNERPKRFPLTKISSGWVVLNNSKEHSIILESTLYFIPDKTSGIIFKFKSTIYTILLSKESVTKICSNTLYILFPQ